MTLEIKWTDIQPKINEHVIEALIKGFGFETLMPVQKTAIPLMIKNHDLAVSAETGSGQTLAFLVPILHILLNNVRKVNIHKVYALVIAPTRELAKQIQDNLIVLLDQMENILTSFLLIGGGNKESENSIYREKGGNILVGTPGKLRDFMESEQIKDIRDLQSFQVLILDEADRLIEQEYLDDVKQIIAKLPKQRRTSLFSATLGTSEMDELIKLGLRNPVAVNVYTGLEQRAVSIPEKLENHYIVFQNRVEKIQFLIKYVVQWKSSKIILFFNTCATVQFYSKLFKSAIGLFKNVNFYEMHGHMKQKRRNKVCEAFSKCKNGVLITTDVVARGLDFQNVNVILQVDPPQDPNFFVHRIGRTARQGKQGEAILFLEENQEAFVGYLKLRKLEISEIKRVDVIDESKLDKEDIEKDLKRIIHTDRDVVEKSKAAFLSYIRSYKENELKYIFEFQNLDIGNVANSYYLLRIPRAKEILGKKIENFQQSDIDPSSIPFADQNQELQYKDKLQKREQESKIEPNEVIKDQERKLQELEIKQKKDIKNIGHVRRKIKKERDENDFQDYCQEDRLTQKLKRGKISVTQYLQQMRELEPDDLKDIQFNRSTILNGSRPKNKKKKN